MVPVSNTPGSVAVWANVSEFNQFTVWPTLTITGLGENTLFLIVTVSKLGGFTHSGFVGVGEQGLVGEVVLALEPHPTAKSATMTTAPTADKVATEFLTAIFQDGATPVPPTLSQNLPRLQRNAAPQSAARRRRRRVGSTRAAVQLRIQRLGR